MTTPLVIIQARCQSHRFPGKVLAYLKGKPVIQRVIDAVPSGYGIIVATGAAHDNFPLGCYVNNANNIDVLCHEPESDVLGRFADVVQRLGRTSFDPIVRLTADCPLHSPDVIRQTVDAFDLSMGYLFSHWLWPLPKGQEVEVFTRQMLLDAHREATDPHDREHVTPWMRRTVGDRPALYTGENLSVDTVEDLHRLEAMP